MTEPLVSVRGVRKSFGDNDVLKDISFDVAPGTVTVVIGPSGSGKTTLAKALGDCIIDDRPEDDIVTIRRIQFTPDLMPADIVEHGRTGPLYRPGHLDRLRELFEAFARSFFCNQNALSAAELVAMFHYYFLGNPEGIGFDVPNTDHATAVWNPLREHLIRHGADIRLGAAATNVAPEGHGWRVELASGEGL